MAHIFLKHQVADFDTWRPYFDDFAVARAAIGIKDVAVLRDADDPNTVWLVHEADPALLRPTMADPDFAKAMADAGVLGTPEVFAGRAVAVM